MRLELGLAQKLGLQLKLAPQIIQSIEILQLPASEPINQALHTSGRFFRRVLHCLGGHKFKI